MQEIIRKKSWLAHCFIISSRALLTIVGVDSFQLSFESSKSNQNLNQGFIHTSGPYLIPILISLTPLGAILDIAVWWRPNLARFICYFEVIYLGTLMFCPLDFGALHHIAVTVSIFIEYLLFGSFDGANNVLFTFVLMLRLLVIGPIICVHYLSSLKIIESLIYKVAVFKGFNILSMLNYYIV